MATQMDEFTRLFGPEGTEIDFSCPSVKSQFPLPVPQLTDTLDDAVKKLEAIAKVVADGKSAAVFTGHLNATQWDAEILAMETMDHVEKMQYIRWKKGISLPAIDWKNNVKEIPSGQDALCRYKVRAAAVAMVWGEPTASPENAAWICSNLPYCKPLVFAVTRLHDMERHVREKMTKIREYELAESKTISRVTDVVTHVLEERIRRVNQAKETLQAREKALNRKETERNNATDPIKHQQQEVGDPRLRPLEKHCATVGGEEDKRADGVKKEPRDDSAGKRPRKLSDPQEFWGPPSNSPRGPKRLGRPVQMGRRGGSNLSDRRV